MSSTKIQPERQQPEQQDTEARIPSVVNRQPLNPGKQFFFSHHPLRWDWNPVQGFLPSLATHQLMAGVCGVSSRKTKYGEQFNVSRLEADIYKRGGTVIRPSDIHLGRHNPYLASFPMDDGRKWWVFHATTLSLVRGSAPIFTMDMAEWADFLVTVRDNILAPMTDDGFHNFQKNLSNSLATVKLRLQTVGANSVYEGQIKDIEDVLTGSAQTWADMNQGTVETSAPERDAEDDFGIDFNPEEGAVEEAAVIKPKRGRKASR